MLFTASVALSILRFGEKKADREVFVVLSIVSLSSLPILGNPVPNCLKTQKSINVLKERFEDSEQRTKLFGKVSFSS